MLITIDIVVSSIAAVQKAQEEKKNKMKKLEKIDGKKFSSGFIFRLS